MIFAAIFTTNNHFAMKKILVLIVLLASLTLTLNSCRRVYDEIGRDSIYYYYNGEEQDEVTCFHYLSLAGYRPDRMIEYYKQNDSVKIAFCISHEVQNRTKNEELSFYISDYHGPDIYRFGTGLGTGDTCDLSYETSLYDDRSYLQILELDTVHKTISALFECHFLSNSGGKIDLTQGRVFFDMGDNFQIIRY